MKHNVKHGEHTLSTVANGVTSEHMKLFSKRLKKLMGNEIKDGELGKSIPCSAPTVRRWRMASGLPTLRAALKIAAYFRTEPYALFQGTPLEALYKTSLSDAVPRLRDGKTTTPPKAITTEAAAAAHPPAVHKGTNGGSHPDAHKGTNGGSHPTEKKEEAPPAVSTLPDDIQKMFEKIDEHVAFVRVHLDRTKETVDALKAKVTEKIKESTVNVGAIREHLNKFNTLLQN